MVQKKLSKLIEIDVDGVLLDPYTPAEHYLMRNGIRVDFNKCSTYGLYELGVQRRSAIKALISSEVRRNSRPYPGAEQFLRQLAAIASEYYWQIVLHTSEFEEACIPVKAKLLRDLTKQLPAQAPVSGNIVLGEKPMFANAFICIEDSVENLERSPAPVKICRSQFHNKGVQFLRTDSYAVMIEHILHVMKDIG